MKAFFGPACGCGYVDGASWDCRGSGGLLAPTTGRLGRLGRAGRGWHRQPHGVCALRSHSFTEGGGSGVLSCIVLFWLTSNNNNKRPE